jgi:hypothetical protein
VETEIGSPLHTFLYAEVDKVKNLSTLASVERDLGKSQRKDANRVLCFVGSQEVIGEER